MKAKKTIKLVLEKGECYTFWRKGRFYTEKRIFIFRKYLGEISEKRILDSGFLITNRINGKWKTEDIIVDDDDWIFHHIGTAYVGRKATKKEEQLLITEILTI